MAIDSFLNVSFGFDTFVATSKQALLDRIELLLTTATGGLPVADRWSVITAAVGGTGRWRMPLTSGLRTSDVELLDGTGLIVELRVFNQVPTNIMVGGNREFNHVTATATYEIYYGPTYLYVYNTTDDEFGYGGIVDQSAMDDAASGIYTFAAASRNAANAVGEDAPSFRTKLDAAIATMSEAHLVTPYAEDQNPGNNGDHAQTNTAAPWYTYVETCQSAVAGQPTPDGREFNMIWVDQSNAVGSLLTVNIDDGGITGTFKVLSFRNQVFDSVARQAMRVA